MAAAAAPAPKPMRRRKTQRATEQNSAYRPPWHILLVLYQLSHLSLLRLRRNRQFVRCALYVYAVADFPYLRYAPSAETALFTLALFVAPDREPPLFQARVTMNDSSVNHKPPYFCSTCAVMSR